MHPSFGLFAVLLASVLSTTVLSLKTLVLVKNELSKAEYSVFLSSLKSRGHELEIKARGSSSNGHASVSYTQFGERIYDNVVVLDTEAAVSAAGLIDFLNRGGNVLSAVDGASPDSVRKFAGRVGVSMNAAQSAVIDDVECVDGDHQLVLLKSIQSIGGLFSDEESVPQSVLFKGVGLSLKSSNHLAFSALSGNPSTVSMKADSLLATHSGGTPEQNMLAGGRSLSLVSVLQTRFNSRVAIVGSSMALSNQLMSNTLGDNQNYFRQLTEWVFQEKGGVLRLAQWSHRAVNDEFNTVNPTRYRITDEIQVTAKIEQYNRECDCWTPYIANDVEFELVRLDPFHRDVLEHTGDGVYKAQFALPDTFGVYKVRLDYMRRGMTHIFDEKLISVRPYSHSEYARFLLIAAPYYLSSFSMLAGFVLFTLFFVFGSEKHTSGGIHKVWR